MVPRPGERDWWTATRHPVQIGPDFDPVEMFLHDVPADVVAASADHAGPQAVDPDDRAVAARRAGPTCRRGSSWRATTGSSPRAWQREVVRERLGIEPDEIGGGHCVALSRPRELVELLEALRILRPTG